MSEIFTPTGAQTYNFLTHLYANNEITELVKNNMGELYLQLLHFKSIGSSYCPRVLLTAEKMLRKAQHSHEALWTALFPCTTYKAEEALTHG